MIHMRPFNAATVAEQWSVDMTEVVLSGFN